MFSDRLARTSERNRLSQAVDARRASGAPLIDLTQSNPTRADIEYPPDLLDVLGDRTGLVYAPEPLGIPAARDAVAGDYARRGVLVDPSRIALTASTSEAYSLLFKILCDPGDEVLVPQPSYPLFEHLTRLEGVIARPYRLEYHGAWTIDIESVRESWSPRTRAVLLVSPNNPTGSFARPDEWRWLAEWCAGKAAALIADEVFADYELRPGAAAGAARVFGDPPGEGLVFSLGGLSKTVGLPQVKLGWIAAGGSPNHSAAAIERLEFACDTYLSVSTAVQTAAARLLENGTAVRRRIHERVRENHAQLSEALGACPSLRLLAADAGWYAVVQAPSVESEDDLVVRLVRDEGVLVHPGYFYDFPRETYLVVSLLPAPATFARGIAPIVRHFTCIAKAPTP